MSTVEVMDSEDLGAGPVVGRSLREIALGRLRRDRVATVSLGVLVVIVLLAAFAPLICAALGLSPNKFNSDLIGNNGGLPVGRLGGVSLDHPLGVEPLTGRDILARLLYGARVSLLVALLAAVVTIVTGVLVGIIAGNSRGWLDSVLSRFMDITLAFPFLLVVLAMSPVMEQRLVALGVPKGDTARITTVVLLLSIFGWPYLARLIRGQVLSLREREFVEAAISLGAGSRRILFRELLPNLWAPILVYATIAMPGYIGIEAALGYLGVSVQPPTATLGAMLADSVSYFTVDPFYLVPPVTLLLATVLSFNLLGDALRDALDPKAEH